MSGIKHVAAEVATTLKATSVLGGWLAALLGYLQGWLVDYLNPTLAAIAPLLSTILVLVLLRLHMVNIKKSDAETEKIKAEQAKADAELRQLTEKDKG